MIDMEKLKFDEKGLIPAIVVDGTSGQVLTLAYMNKESLEISIQEERTCFWSRSRQELWRKGETSGNAQHITITSSSNMSKEDIEKAVKEAEQYAAEDAKIKEKVEVRNQADQMVYQAEKTLNEVGDKVPESEKAPIQAGIDKLKETLKGEDSDAIKAATEELTQQFYKMSEKLYQQQAPQGDPNMGGQQPGGDPNGGQQYYDADYKVVDDDDQNNK